MLFPSAQHRDDEMNPISKNNKWGGYREAIEGNKGKSGKSPSGKQLQEDRAGARIETLGLRLLHKKINRGTKITPTSPCWTAEEQEVAKHLVFCFC